MSFQTPISKCRTTIPGLGTLDGLQYANSVQQFCGIPYVNLPKRWTRSTLNTSWNGSHHDGTGGGGRVGSRVRTLSVVHCQTLARTVDRRDIS
ncbi:Pc03g00230 [Penicillium rubens Wisconsin 54-1255]|uniref:Pc03g00230 protein n=1 Tax=Penicillium rubens (strain ATCC 28089 / DSM 1075 / NRRL 1951 / Wisconsin 54-1255) TaxID=500485 RepID=B6GVS0_PENRW|nr:Pc03g00230 [Penicillium rubens Wisconsin 54-1255]